MLNKTYGIYGLSEWHGNIKAGSISVKVSFTGGTVAPSGAQPAFFMTKDPITQFVIENSKEFKSGFIHIEMVQETPGTHPRMATPKAVKSSGEPEGDAPLKETEEPKTKGTEMNFACNDDAKDYLAETYGVSRSKMRNKADIEKAAKDYGITIIWKE